MELYLLWLFQRPDRLRPGDRGKNGAVLVPDKTRPRVGGYAQPLPQVHRVW